MTEELGAAIARKLELVEVEINSALAKSNRSRDQITLCAISKLQPIEAINAFLKICQERGTAATIGESYVQEYKKKRGELSSPYAAHLVGTLQSNKANEAVRIFDLIQSLHSEKIVAAVNDAAARIGKIQDVMLQVNISADPSKAGFKPEGVLPFLHSFAERCPALRFHGLMTITALYGEAEGARRDFRRMAELGREIEGDRRCSPALSGRRCRLSMGMSSDFTVALEEGADIIRVGTRIFGEREP